jgi:hypothetical protein
MRSQLFVEHSGLQQRSICASYVELYNEAFRDLLAPATKPALIRVCEQQ